MQFIELILVFPTRSSSNQVDTQLVTQTAHADQMNTQEQPQVHNSYPQHYQTQPYSPYAYGPHSPHVPPPNGSQPYTYYSL